MRWSRISAIGILFVLLVTPVWSFAGMMEVPFHADESVYTFMSRYFDLYFLKRDFSNPEWDSTVVWSVTQPPVSKYVIGLALFATGHDFAELHPPWNWGLDKQANFDMGNVPSDSALTASRSMMTVLFTLSIVLCAAIAYRLSGLVGALIAGLLFATSGLALAYLRRATADAPLVFFGLLAVVSSVKLVDSLSVPGVGSGRRSLGWAAMTGLWVGLAGGSKPSAAALIPMVLVAPVVAWLVGRSRGKAVISPARALRLPAVYAILLTIIVLAFVIPNPMLYENPMEGIKAMIDHRASAANTQQREAPDDALATVSARAKAMVQRVFHPLGLVAFLCGLALVVWQELGHWRRHTVSARTVVLLWIGGTLAFTAFFTPMNWGRYFVSLVPCQAVVLGGLGSAAVGLIRERRWRLDWRASQTGAGHRARLFDVIAFDPQPEQPATSPTEESPKPSLRHLGRIEEKILVLIPAHNEEQSLGSVLSQVRKHMPSADILVIDDGSTDATVDVAREAGVFAVSLVGNLGIGAAVQTGFILAHQMGYPVVARVDADGQHNPAVLPQLIASLEEESADVIVGSRYLEPGHPGTSFPRRVGSRLLGGLISAITGQKVTDPTSGMQVLNRDALAFCANHYPYDYPEPESRVLLHRAGFTVKEVPVIAARRVTGRSSIGVLDSAYYMVRVTIAVLVELLRPPRRERRRDAKS